MEKYILRKAFENRTLLPAQVLWRQKEAFSDGVGHDWKRGALHPQISHNRNGRHILCKARKIGPTGVRNLYRQRYESCLVHLSGDA